MSRALRCALAVLPFVMVATSFACAPDPIPEPNDVVPPGDTKKTDVDKPPVTSNDAGATPDAPEVKTAPYHVIGRYDGADAAGPRLSWSGTQVRGKFTGTGLVVKMRDSIICCGKGDQVEVTVDGAAPVVLELAGEAPYTVAQDLPNAEHEFVLTKRTEPFVGVVQILGIEPTGGALVPTPVPAPTRRIQLVGDSITCGYGILVNDPLCNFSPATEAETAAWGALAAKELGAERSIVAWSGIGVYRDSGGSTVDQMPAKYDRAVPTEAASTWDHATAPPDVIVVNLGTNDFAMGDPGQPFENAYGTFLAKLRTTHPNAYVVVATSPMLTDSFPEGEQRRTKSLAALTRIVDARKASGDTKIGLLAIDEQDGNADGFACDYHPSAKTAQKMAAKLVAFVKSALNW